LQQLVHFVHETGIPFGAYAAGPVKNTDDYIMVWQQDKAKVHYVKVIPNEECAPKHKLLVMDMQFNKKVA